MPYADSMTLRLRAALLGSMVAGVLVPSCGGESTDTSASAPRIDGGLTTDATGEDVVVGPVVDSSVVDSAVEAASDLGKFRLSVTTSNRSTFADGNEGTTTPGNVGASGIWTVLQPRRQCATSGATMTIGGDSSILVQDLNSTDALYVVEADTTLVGITGVRLEVLEDGVLPQTGPGLQNSNGNFVLADFTVRAGTP